MNICHFNSKWIRKEDKYNYANSKWILRNLFVGVLIKVISGLKMGLDVKGQGPVSRSMVSVNQRLIPWQRIGFILLNQWLKLTMLWATQPRSKKGVDNDIFWSNIGSGFGKPSSTPPPALNYLFLFLIYLAFCGFSLLLVVVCLCVSYFNYSILYFNKELVLSATLNTLMWSTVM